MQNTENIAYEYDSMRNEYLRLQKDMRLAKDIISEVQDENNKFEHEIYLLKKQRDLLAEECSEMDESISWERGNGKDFKSKEEWLRWSEKQAREAENG